MTHRLSALAVIARIAWWKPWYRFRMTGDQGFFTLLEYMALMP